MAVLTVHSLRLSSALLVQASQPVPAAMALREHSRAELERAWRELPDAHHSLDGSEAMEIVVSDVQGFRDDKARQSFTWKLEGSDTVRVQTQDKPSKVQLWQATNPKARDFRVETLGKVWKSTDLTDQGGGVYVAKVAPPATGYTAFYIEMTYPSGQLFPYKFSTQVRVVPDVRPFAGINPKTGKYEGTGP